MVDARTKRLTREQLAAFFPDNPRAIKLFENLTQDVSVTLPDAVDSVRQESFVSMQAVDGAKGTAQAAQQLALEVQALQQATARAGAQVVQLLREVDMLRAELHDTRARLASAVLKAQTTADQALLLTTGA